MEAFFITVLSLIILGLLSIIYDYKQKLKHTNKLNQSLQFTINAKSIRVKEHKDVIDELEDNIHGLRQNIILLESYLEMFIIEKLKVFVRSNFHSNYNVYNNKFYAKVNGKTSSSKVEGIPVLTLSNNKYSVIDIYKFKKLQRKHPEAGILTNLEQSRTGKEDLIRELGNKVLTSYSQ